MTGSIGWLTVIFSIIPLLILGVIVAIVIFSSGKKSSATWAATDAPAKPLKTNPNDFADWLSPILVKELRQGMRARVFVSSFLILQALMIFNVLVALLGSQSTDYNTGFTTAFFWMMIGLPVLIVMPLSGLGAVSNEMRGNTLELIFLTRLTSWRIIAGKWLSIFCQIVLLVCAILPYAVLRYFIGGVNIMQDLQTIGWMLVSAAVLLAVTVGVSPFHSRMTRVVLVIFVVLFVIGGVNVLETFLFRGVMRSGGSAGGFDFAWTMTARALSAIFILVMFEIGASRIAPPADNHATRKRLLGVPLLLLPLWPALTSRSPTPLLVAAMAIALPICVAALCEDPRYIASIYRPFLKLGLLGRAAGRLLYPGWVSGTIYTLLLSSGFFWILHHFEGWSWQDPIPVLVFISICSALLLPVAISRTFFRNSHKPFGVYIGFQLGLLILGALVLLADNAAKLKMITVFSVIPTCVLLSGLDEHDYFQRYSLQIFAAAALIIALLVPRMFAVGRRVRVVEREVRGDLLAHAKSRTTV